MTLMTKTVSTAARASRARPVRSLSSGRVILGIGGGYLEPEFRFTLAVGDLLDLPVVAVQPHCGEGVEYKDPPLCNRLMTRQPAWQRSMTPGGANPELDDRCAKIHRVGRGS